jgi:hypothetical protein
MALVMSLHALYSVVVSYFSLVLSANSIVIVWWSRCYSTPLSSVR